MQHLRAIALISICGIALPGIGPASASQLGAVAAPLGLGAFPPPSHVRPVGLDPAPDDDAWPVLRPPSLHEPPSPTAADAAPAPATDPAGVSEGAPQQAGIPSNEAEAQPAAHQGAGETNGHTVLTSKSKYANVWDHIRAGFKMPTIVDPLVTKWENFYAARPDYWQRINERGRRYLYFITKEIERRGMPLEIALLPVIESAYNPEALSRARALGIWQFIPATGKHYGLEQNWWQDNRRDVSVATISALDYLEKLYDMFGDWQHALAAYNWGEGAVQRAIAKNRARGKPIDWASLKIPNETRNYLPKLQAVKNIVLAPEKFALGLPEIPDAPYFVTVTTPRQIDVALAAKLADMPLDDFKALNSAHNRPVIAGPADLRINLPREKAELFVMNLDAYQKPLVTWRPYQIQNGERLDKIAPRFGIELDELKRVNGLTGRKRIVNGHTLLVPARGEVVAAPIPITQFREAPLDGPGWHRARRGETLARIADRYGVTTADLKKLNGLTDNAALAGRKLRLHDGIALGPSKSNAPKGVKKPPVVPVRRR